MGGMKHAARILPAVLLAAGLMGCPWSGSPRVGDGAPVLSIAQWLNGGPYDVRDGAHVYVVAFWSAYCEFCIDAIPHLTELQAAYADKGVVVIGVAYESAEIIAPFVVQQGDAMAYCVAVDDGTATFDAYGVSSIPRVFVVNTAGKVAWRGHPADDGIEDALDELTGVAR